MAPRSSARGWLRRNRSRSVPRLRANSWRRLAEFRQPILRSPIIALASRLAVPRSFWPKLKSRAALAAASPNGDVFRLEVTKHPVVSIMLYTQVDEAEIAIRARMFGPHLN